MEGRVVDVEGDVVGGDGEGEGLGGTASRAAAGRAAAGQAQARRGGGDLIHPAQLRRRRFLL